jgi:L-threonylcarbamoyladenylate synthase
VVITDLDLAIRAIATGHLCAIPTETVYGLAADARNTDAVSQIFVAKNRPQNHPLIVHVGNYESALDWFANLPDWAQQLAKACWPGPLTLVGQRSQLATDQVTGGQNTVAVRVPNHAVTLQLLDLLKTKGILGLVAPSANRFGHVSPTTANHVETDLGNYLTLHGDLILDGGACEIGIESTIVLAIDDTPVILRPGAISADLIEAITGLAVQQNPSGGPRVSGALASHYAPRAKVYVVSNLTDQNFAQGSGFIALSSIQTPVGLLRLAEPDTSEAFASQLYQAFRHGDVLGVSNVYLVLPGESGIGLAIADRVHKAAHPDKERSS